MIRDHDVFVSYAHLDNQGEPAWVTNLVRRLESEVGPRLGSKDLRIWIDHDLDGNHPLTPEIMQAIRRAATVLLIVSPSYIASEWCARERNAFLGVARDCVSEGRVFIVHCREVDRQFQPPEFGDLKGFKFWTQDSDAGGVMRPLGLADQKEPAYFTAVINLADKLSQKLKEIRTARTAGAPVSAPAEVEHVFVARSADDMETREEELVSHLTQAGLRVLPETWYREDSEQEFRAAMQADLQRCSVFVQLLGGLAGRRATRFAEVRRFPAIQHDIARETGKQILQWRDLAVDPAAVEDQCHRALLEGARAGGFEEFKHAVVEASCRKVETPRQRAVNAAVFVNADRADREIAKNLSELLKEQGVECYRPSEEMNPEKVRQDFEMKLTNCDGLVLIYGATEPSWVINQLLQGRKILGRRDRPLAARAICFAPPPEKIDLAVALPDLITLECRDGVTPQMLRPFVERLTLEAWSMAITLEFSTLPYPGLRPFRDDESDIFFGREAQIDQLLVRLSRNHFLAVTGPSGCGKSSLIKAGMIPALSAGFMLEGGSRWRICELRPGDRPVGGLARKMASADILGADRTDLESIAYIEATLRRGPLGLIEIVRGSETLAGANLLVMIDQFEEIFRYRDRIAVDEADAFVALLLASARQTEVAIYVVITMRSDYLGDCALFHGLPETISDAQYLTPRLTRHDLELAIDGPAQVFGGRVEPRLVNRLINDFGTAPDQLPLLQHTLARLWNIASPKPPVLTVEDYQAIGGLSTALSHHGDEILAELTPEQQRIAEIMFRRLSGTEGGRRDVRAPAQIGEIARIAGVEPDAVIAVAEVFRRADRCFLTAPEGPLDENTLLDLSHESLIRQWHRLADWVSEETKSAETYQRLRDWALRWEQGDAELLRGADLANAIAWRERAAPNEAWAERYGGHDQFRLAMKFLDAGEHAQRATAKRLQQLSRVRRLAWGFGAATVVLLAGIVGYHLANVWDHTAYYKDYVTAWGVPKGIEQLTAAEREHRNRSFRIITRGIWGPVQRMDLVNSAGHLGNGLFALSASPEENADNPFSWEYAYDAQGNIASEVALDRHSHPIRTTIYGLTDSGSTGSRKAYVIKRDGSLAPEKSSCAAYVRYDYSPEGYVTQTHYYDYDKKPTPGKGGAFIKETKHDRFGRTTASTSLGKDGQPMNDMDGNATERQSYDKKGNLTSIDYLDASGNPSDSNKNNFFRLIKTYDDYGNLSRTSAEHANGEPNLLVGSCKTIKFETDGHGNPIETSCLRQDNKLSNSSFATFKNQFDADDQMTESTAFDGGGHRVLGPDWAFREEFKYDSDGNITEFATYGTDDKPVINNMGFHKQVSKFKNGHEIRTEYQDLDGRLTILGKTGFAAVNREYDAQGNETKTTYLGVDKAHPAVPG